MSSSAVTSTPREDRETTTLLPRSSSTKLHTLLVTSDAPSTAARIERHLSQPLRTDHASLIILICYLITGLLDSAATSIWGSFVSMQTGNTIYLATGLSNLIFPTSTSSPSSPDGTRWIKSGVSLASFCLGSYFFARFHRHITSGSPQTRWVLMSSFLIQLMFIIVAIVIVKISSCTPSVTTASDVRWQTLLPLAFLAFQSAGQVVASRVLNQSSLTSVVLTSVYCDLFSDTHLFSFTANKQRNEKVGAVLSIIPGGIVGNFLVRYAGDSGDPKSKGILWVLGIIAALKLGIIVCWGFWNGEPNRDLQTPRHEMLNIDEQDI